MVTYKVSNKDSIFSINSFCTVATKEVKEEVLFLICTIHRLYKEYPILIFCDEVTKYYIDQQKIPHVITQVKEPPLNLNVERKNHYHKPDVIALKMEVMESAILKFKNTIFLDSDIILLDKLSGPSDCNLALSHNLAHVKNVATQSVLDGMFNAGMLWSNTTKFTQWWRNEYNVGNPTFYEQSILNKAPDKFRTSYFDFQHNYGFWRGDVGAREVKSFHCHLGKRLDKVFVPYMNGRVDQLRASVIKRLEKNYPELYLQYERIFHQ